MGERQFNQRLVSEYRLMGRIGAGGTGEVFRGEHIATGEPVAVKILRADHPNRPSADLERFIREGTILRQLNHPNIVKVLTTFHEDGQHFIVMEYVPGGSLRKLLMDQPQLSISRVLALALELADALTRAHHLNVIHRDLKPENVLLAEDGTPRLTDFGTAYFAGTPRITDQYMLIGTPHYISPEAIAGKRVDARSDIWSFGIMLFEMLAGHLPFDAELLTALALAIMQQPVPDLEALRPDAPVALVDLIYRMLDKEPDARIPSVRLVGAEIEAISRGLDLGSHITPDVALERVSFLTTPTPTPRLTKSNLPIQPTPFIGREDELAELARLFQTPSNRLITVVGPGGTGKTRLVMEAAVAQLDFFPDGVYFVPLASLRECCPEEQIVSAIAVEIGFQFRRETGSPDTSQKQQLLDHLRPKTMLLVLDNFEHLLDAAQLVGDILGYAPGVRVLVSSRERLNLHGETMVSLTGMKFPDWELPEDALDYNAVRLFMESARRVRPGFELHADDLTYVARICRQVRGMPLGILLAAAWVEVLSPEEISHEIDQSLDLLETDMINVPERHRSIRAIFESSWLRLSESEQTAFAQLAVFQGGFTREAAQQVTGTELRTLMRLVSKSLLWRRPEGRFEVHELLRRYAVRQLEQSPDQHTRVRDRHAVYYADFLHQQEASIRYGDHHAALAEIDNVRAGWARSVATLDLESIAKYLLSLMMLYESQAWHHEARVVMTEAADALYMADPVGDRGVLYAHVLAFKGAMLNLFNLPGEGRALLRESMGILRQLDARAALAHVQMLAVTNDVFRQIDEAREALNDSIAIFKEHDMVPDVAQAIGILGMAHYRQNEIDEAQQRFEEAYTLFAENQIRPGMAWTRSMLALCIATTGDYAQARPYFQEAMTTWQALDRKSGVNAVYTSWGLAAWTHGDHVEAKQMLRQALAASRESGNIGRIANSLNNLGHPTAALGQYREANQHYFEALRLVQGQPVDANPTVALESLCGIAYVIGKMGAHGSAVELLAMVCQHPLLSPEIRNIATRFLADFERELSPDDYATAWQCGMQLAFDKVVADLLKDE